MPPLIIKRVKPEQVAILYVMTVQPAARGPGQRLASRHQFVLRSHKPERLRTIALHSLNVVTYHKCFWQATKYIFRVATVRLNADRDGDKLAPASQRGPIWNCI